MILADSSVWIDYFNGVPSPQAQRLDSAVGSEVVLVGDLILAEVLQGFRSDEEFRRAQRALSAFRTVWIAGPDIAVASARNFRALRAGGVTIRKTIDCLIATRCIADGLPLLYSDRDFDPFVEHLGLISA